MSIGKNIAKFRKQLNLTQEELGEKLGVTNQAVSKWESAVSMPDVMLLPKIAEALNITLEELYGIAKEGKKALVGADGFPTYCHEKLHELFFVNARMKFGGVDNSDEAQLEFQKQKLKSGCRVGCFSNTKGVFVLTDDFAFIDCDFKESGSEDIIGKHSADDYTLIYLTDNNLRKVLFYQYKTAIKKSKSVNSEFTFEEIVRECNLTVAEAAMALRLLCDIQINESYTDRETKEKKYILRLSNAVYAISIYKLARLLSDDQVWSVVRDTTMISDYAFR